MKQLHPDLFVTECPLRFVGVEVGARMTVIRLAGGKLLLISPISATPDLLREVEALGEVAHLVAPNRFHHLYVGEWKRAYPSATVHVAPGLDTKRSDLEITGVLSDEPEAAWSAEVDQVAVEGVPLANEVAFFHRPSATLILTDLAFNIGPDSPLSTRLFFGMSGAYGKLGPTLIERLLVRDRASCRRSLERILEWPFERVVVAHGQVSEKGGREELVAGYKWLLRN